MKKLIAATALFVALSLSPVFGQITTANSAVFHAVCTGTATSSVTLSFFEMGTMSSSCTGTFVASQSMISPISGTLYNLYVNAGTGGFNASSGVFTLYKNGSAQSVTCTTGTATTCNDTTHSFAVAAGDLIAIKFTTQATETLANISVGFAIRN